MILSKTITVKRAIILFIVLPLNFFFAKAQDPEFSQLFADRLFLNPALTGTLECGELNFNSRNPKPFLGNVYKLSSASFDTHVESIHGGAGIHFLTDSQGRGAVKSTFFSALYSYKFNINRNYKASFGISAGGFQRKIDLQKLIFADMIDPNTGTISSVSGEMLFSDQKIQLDLSTGFVMYSKNLFAGISVFHINSYKTYEHSGLPPRLIVFAGKKIVLNKFDSENNFITLAPYIAYRQQLGEQQVFYGTFLEKKHIKIGILFRQNLILHSVSPVFSYEMSFSRYRISVSYEVLSTQYYALSKHSFEISLSGKLNCKKKITRGNTIYCTF
jgi:type IX secretion system PorP/SprF family membrane protein